jgi:hypothetical protein
LQGLGVITSIENANVAAWRRSAAAGTRAAWLIFSIPIVCRLATNATAALAALAQSQHMRGASLRDAAGATAFRAGLAGGHAVRGGFVAGGTALPAGEQRISVLHQKLAAA